MNGATADPFPDSLTRVLDYIDTHLDEDLSVERLSQVAHFSKFHFHRLFSAHAGISVSRYVQLMRLKRASYRLVFSPQARIIDIALEAGFDSPEAFARAFRNTFGQTPTQFRQSPEWQPWKGHYHVPKRERTAPMEVRIVQFEATPVAALEHRGSPDRVFETVQRFIAWRKASGLSPVATSRTFNIVHNDPEGTEPDQYRVDVCGSVAGPVPDNPQGVVPKVIPAGRCAVVRHLGSHDRIGESAGYLYREWLPASGETLRDFPLVLHFLNRMPDTPEHELVTDIHLPLT